LDVEEHKKDLILFEFTHLPARLTSVLFLAGVSIGLYQGTYLLQSLPEMNPAFPGLGVATYTLDLGFSAILLFAVTRSAGLIGRLFNEKMRIDIFDQSSLYVISQYSAWNVIILAIPGYLQYILLPSFVETIPSIYIFGTVFVGLLSLIVFWLPLRGVNRKLVSEKNRLLKDVNLRIRTNFDLINAKMDQRDYQDIAGIREMSLILQLEKDTIRSIRTWPWQTSTITGVLSAVVLPVVVGFLISIIDRFLNF